MQKENGLSILFGFITLEKLTISSNQVVHTYVTYMSLYTEFLLTLLYTTTSILVGKVKKRKENHFLTVEETYKRKESRNEEARQANIWKEVPDTSVAEADVVVRRLPDPLLLMKTPSFLVTPALSSS